MRSSVTLQYRYALWNTYMGRWHVYHCKHFFMLEIIKVLSANCNNHLSIPAHPAQALLASALSSIAIRPTFQLPYLRIYFSTYFTSLKVILSSTCVAENDKIYFLDG